MSALRCTILCLARRLRREPEPTSPRLRSLFRHLGRADSAEDVARGHVMAHKLFVGGLPFSVTSERLREVFAAAGVVESATVVTDTGTGRSRGFGFEIGRASCRERV